MNKVDTDTGIRYQLTDEERAMLTGRAAEATVNTYPLANQGYAVALMTASGNIYEGVSYKSRSHHLTMHSEATALANAAIHGEKEVVAITGPNCNICQQLIYESGINSGIDVMIIMEKDGVPNDIPISELLPYASLLHKDEDA